MTGWLPHWPTVIVSIASMFVVSFGKGLAEQFARHLLKRRRKERLDEQR